jgi:[acyl-carrier-protein] S-malonyltransferase
MAPAADGLARHLAGVALRDPAVPVWTSVDARPVRDAADVRALLVRQLTAPVGWEETAREVTTGAALALEVGPGKVLTGLLRRIRPEVGAVAIGEPDDVEAARAALAGVAAHEGAA